MTAVEMEHVLEMPVEQKILFIEDVWDSIRPQSKQIPVPESHKQELERRFEKYKKNRSALLSDQQLKDRLGFRG